MSLPKCYKCQNDTKDLLGIIFYLLIMLLQYFIFLLYFEAKELSIIKFMIEENLTLFRVIEQ
jgi:hypothetical protein